MPRRLKPYRKRGDAQRLIARYIIEHKQDDNGNSPTFEELAEYMGYTCRMTAYNVVSSVVAKNRPNRPHFIDLGDPYGKVWLNIDEHGRPVVHPGEFVIEARQQPLWEDDPKVRDFLPR